MKAIDQLPARIAAKINSITDKKLLGVIRSNRLARKNGDYNRHIRRHHIFLACIDRRIELFNAKRAEFRAIFETL